MEISKAGFFRSYYEAAQQITDDGDRLAFYEAILGYMFEGTDPAGLSPLANIAFIAIRPNIDAELKRKRGGAPAGNSNARKQAENQKAYSIEEEPAPEEKPAAKKKFQKPTLEEIKNYCQERGNGVNAQQFLDFYESKGWKVGKETMKDWRACVRTWEQRERPKFPIYGQSQQLPPDRLEL